MHVPYILDAHASQSYNMWNEKPNNSLLLYLILLPSVWLHDYESTNGWTNEWTDEWMKEWMDEVRTINGLRKTHPYSYNISIFLPKGEIDNAKRCDRDGYREWYKY